MILMPEQAVDVLTRPFYRKQHPVIALQSRINPEHWTMRSPFCRRARYLLNIYMRMSGALPMTQSS